jgi:hypothetical protein
MKKTLKQLYYENLAKIWPSSLLELAMADYTFIPDSAKVGHSDKYLAQSQPTNQQSKAYN